MPVTASLLPSPPSSLPLCPRKQQSAQTELFPLRVIMAANRWRLGRESLEDAGPEMLHELKSRIQPKIGAPRIIIFEKSKTIVAPTIAEKLGPLFCLRDLRISTRIYLIPGETQSGSRHSTSNLDVTLAVETQSGFQVTRRQILTLHSAPRTGEGGGGCPKRPGEGGAMPRKASQSPFHSPVPFS
jgi:hypothetical protein